MYDTELTGHYIRGHKIVLFALFIFCLSSVWFIYISSVLRKLINGVKLLDKM